MHPWIFDACQTSEGVDVGVLLALKSTLTLDDLLDIREAKHVRESWAHAELLNNAVAQQQAEQIRKLTR